CRVPSNNSCLPLGPVADYSPPTVLAIISKPQAAKQTPATRPNQWPIGIVFSNRTKRARPAIQNRFMMPPKNKRLIKNQQQPRQYAPCSMRGVSFGVAVTFVAEIGDLRRFDNPRQLMAFLGLVPSDRSTGERVRRAGLTLAGNKRARRVLIEGAWSYRYPARVSQTLQARLEGLPKTVRAIAWKAQIRLCARYRRLTAAGKSVRWSLPQLP